MPTIIEVDFTDVSLEFEPLPAGLYEVSVHTVEVLPSKKSGELYVKWTLQVENPEYAGRLLFLNNTLQQQGLFSIAQSLTAFGYEIPKDRVSLDLEETIGLRCMARVTQEPYEGQIKNTVSGLVPIGGTDDEESEIAAAVDEVFGS